MGPARGDAARRRALAALERIGLADRARRTRAAGRRRSRLAADRLRVRTASRAARAATQTSDQALLTVTPVTDVGRRAVVARTRTDPTVRAAIGANHELAATTLDLESIPSITVAIRSPNRRRIAVAASDRDRVLRSLRRHAPATTYLYLDDSSIPARQRLQLVAGWSHRATRLAERADVWRVFEFLSDPGGTDVLGDLHGCEIEFWLPGEQPDELIGPRANDEALTLTPDHLTAGDAETTPTRTMPTTDEVDFPIDVVLTWVDGDDPAWRRRRADALGLDRSLDPGDSSPLHDEAASDARYASYDELRYALRSIERYADFVRHVYIVTDDQRPDWLVEHHPRLTVVDHREIFDDDDIPTFNSHSIEARLHHVPGLSEHYLYLNDDFILGRRVEPSTFFHANGLACFYPSTALVPGGPIGPTTKPVDAAAMNGRDLIARRFGRLAHRKMRHAPYPQLRSVHLEIEAMFPEEVARTTASRVRSPSDLSLASFLHHHVAYLTGRAVPGSLSTDYVDLGRPDLEWKLERLLDRRNLDAICLNDTDSDVVDTATKRRLVTAFLTARFPEPSTFER